MLLEFSAKNYRSFKDEFTFSMIPAPKQKGLDYSLMKEKIGKKVYKGLSSAVIYGANASGKTNIIGAMDTLRSIIVRGNINNCDSIGTPNAASCLLELIPFNGSDTVAPVEFDIKFIDNNFCIEYKLSIDLGVFLKQDYNRKITFEELSINDKIIYQRKEHLILDNLKHFKSYLNIGVDKVSDSISEIAENGLVSTELFLTGGFKNIISKDLSSMIIDWFTNKFIVLYQANSIQLIRRFINPRDDSIIIENTTNKIAKEFGINSNAIGFKASKSDDDYILCSLFKNEDGGTAIPATMFESYGTIRFINEFPLIIRALTTGAVLVIDEFDASIHPMALMNIINIFHNDDINIKHAQLIFNTHNPIFLNSNLYRRDEIKFVERDNITHESSHYSLSDFKTSGKAGVRLGEDYMKNYFISQYGAIQDIDFAPILESLISENEEDSKL